MANIKNKAVEGFTIVETLIVLAIAALIITIVLIAVPDLQRAGRNNNIKNDAEHIGTGIGTYESNNNGGIPSALAITTPGTVQIGSSTSTQNNVSISPSDKLTAATGTSYSYATACSAASTICPGNIYYAIGYTCSATSGKTITLTAATTGVAVLYPIEIAGASGGGNVGCVQG